MVCTIHSNWSANLIIGLVYIGEQNVAISIAERPNPVYDPDVLVDEEITGS
jgi:hypothetical protein